MLKWSKNELMLLPNNTVEFDEQFEFDKATIQKIERLNDLRKIQVQGIGRYDHSLQRFYVDMTISGDMIVPCAITLEDVLVPLEISSTETFAFEKAPNEDAIEVKGEYVELLPVILQLIVMEIPWKVIKEGIESYPRGDGWEVLKEEELLKEKKEMDPRLAKLKEFKFDE